MSVPNAPIIAYRNLLREGSLAGPGTPTHAVDWRLDRSWRPGGTSATLDCTLPSAQPAEALAIAGHNLAGGSVTLRAWTGSAFIDVATIQPTNAACVMATFHAVSASRWQIAIQGPQPIAIAVLFVGPVLALESGLRQGFVPPLFSQQAEILDTTSHHARLSTGHHHPTRPLRLLRRRYQPPRWRCRPCLQLSLRNHHHALDRPK